MAAAYDCLRAFAPFSGWKLPHSDEIAFYAVKMPHKRGDYFRYARTTDHVIRASIVNIGHFDTLCKLIAHEMVHLRQAIAKTETPKTQHNAEFYRYAKAICRRMGWDEKDF